MDSTKAATRLIWPVIIWLESKERLLDLPRLFTGLSPPPYVRGLFCQKENPLARSVNCIIQLLYHFQSPSAAFVASCPYAVELSVQISSI